MVRYAVSRPGIGAIKWVTIYLVTSNYGNNVEAIQNDLLYVPLSRQ